MLLDTLMLSGRVAPILVAPRMGTLFFFLGDNLVSWGDKKQPTVSRSSCESEYRAMANIAAKVLWVINLLRELHVVCLDSPVLFCDNQSSLFLTQNHMAHKRAKHIDIDYHFVRELVSASRLVTQFIPPHLHVANIFTKSLGFFCLKLFDPRFASSPSYRFACGGC